jgi:hypothetical protein
MSARLTTHNAGLIAHTILGSPIPALPTPVTLPVAFKTDKRKYNGRKPNPNAPWCMACRVAMKQHRGPTKGKRWTCRVCERNSIYQRTTGEPRGGGPWGKYSSLSHPCCVLCHNAMAHHSKGVWRCCCTGKGVYCNARRTQSQAPRARTASGRLRTATGRKKLKKHSPRFVPNFSHPHCVSCRWQMRACGNKSKPRWECNLCGASCCRAQTADKRRRTARPQVDGNELLAFVTAMVPRHYDDRDDIIQELMLLILTGEMDRGELTPLRVRQIGRAILKSHSEYLNISLESTNREGVRLEERLVG